MKYMTLLSILIGIFLICGCNNFGKCYDCGEGGWQKTYQCDEINTKEDAFNCLFDKASGTTNFPKPENVDDINEGYIEIAGLGIESEPFTSSIFVYNFHRLSVDKSGNVYVETYLG